MQTKAFANVSGRKISLDRYQSNAGQRENEKNGEKKNNCFPAMCVTVWEEQICAPHVCACMCDGTYTTYCVIACVCVCVCVGVCEASWQKMELDMSQRAKWLERRAEMHPHPVYLHG